MDHIQRHAVIIRESGEVSSISEMTQGREPWLDKAQERTHEIVRGIPETVTVGMIRQPDGSFAWPIGHANESTATRRAREAANQPKPDEAA